VDDVLKGGSRKDERMRGMKSGGRSGERRKEERERRRSEWHEWRVGMRRTEC
jgi:hypothetical protein